MKQPDIKNEPSLPHKALLKLFGHQNVATKPRPSICLTYHLFWPFYKGEKFFFLFLTISPHKLFQPLYTFCFERTWNFAVIFTLILWLR